MKRLLFLAILLAFIASLEKFQTGLWRRLRRCPSQALRIAIACVGCHNTRARTGGLALDGLDLQAAADDAQIWEKALRKLRGHLMPPQAALSRRREM